MWVSEAWNAARDLLSVARTRCAQRLSVLRACNIWDLPSAEIELLRDALEEGFRIGNRYAHEAQTIPPRPSSGTYSAQTDEVTEVRRPPRKR